MAHQAWKPDDDGARGALRRRMRAAGLRPARIWVPDTHSPAFIDECRRQSKAIAAADPAGDAIMRFVAGVYDWADD